MQELIKALARVLLALFVAFGIPALIWALIRFVGW